MQKEPGQRRQEGAEGQEGQEGQEGIETGEGKHARRAREEDGGKALGGTPHFNGLPFNTKDIPPPNLFCSPCSAIHDRKRPGAPWCSLHVDHCLGAAFRHHGHVVKAQLLQEHDCVPCLWSY